MSKGIEIFKGQQEIIKSMFEKDGYDWEKVLEKLKNIEIIEEIDKKLDQLKGKTEDYYLYLKGLVEKERISSTGTETVNQNSSVDLKQKWKEETKKQITEKIEQKIGKIPVVGGILTDILNEGFDFLSDNEEKKEDGFFDKIGKNFKKWLGGVILGFFGIKGLDKYLEENKGLSMIDGLKMKTSGITTEIKNISHNSNEKLSEVFKNKYSSTGLLILKSFSIHKFEAQDTTDLFSKFQNKNFSDLEKSFSKMDNSGEMNEAEVQKFKNETNGLEGYSTKDIYNMLKIFFATKTTNIIFRERLSTKSIKNIIDSIDKQKLDKILGEGKVEKIIEKNYNFYDLDLKTITTLLGLSYKGFLGSSILEGFEAGKNFFNDLFFGEGSSNVFNELKEDIEERKNNLLPASVYGVLKGDSGINFGGTQKVDIKISDLDTSKLNNPEDLKKLEKFLSFRDTVLNEFRNSTSKFALGLPDFRENFDKVINLKEIIYLYLVFDGSTHFLNGSDSMLKSGIYVWLYKIFEGNNQTEKFSGVYLAKIKNSLSDGTTYFTDDEKIFIDIFIYKVIGLFLSPYLRNIKQAEGFINQGISNFLIEKGVSKDYANELAYIIEGVGGVISFFTLKKLKLLRFVIIPLIPAIGLLLAGGYNESVFKNQIKEEQYQQIKNIFNEFLAEEKPKVKIDGKEIVVTSLNDLKKANNNPTEVVENQREFKYFIIENGKIKEKESKEDAEKSKIYIEENNTGYNIFYNGNKYRIVNSLEVFDSLNSMLPDSWEQRKFTNHQLTENGIKFGSGADYFEISYARIQNAFKKSPDEDGNYVLKKDNWLAFDVILKKQ